MKRWLNRHDFVFAWLCDSWSFSVDVIHNRKCVFFSVVASGQKFFPSTQDWRVRLSARPSVTWAGLDCVFISPRILAYAGFYTHIWPPRRDALEAPLKIHHRVKLTLFLIIIHCRQQVSKDNYHSFQKGNNSGYCAKAVIDSFCCAGRLKLTAKSGQNEKRCRCARTTSGEYE